MNWHDWRCDIDNNEVQFINSLCSARSGIESLVTETRFRRLALIGNIVRRKTHQRLITQGLIWDFQSAVYWLGFRTSHQRLSRGGNERVEDGVTHSTVSYAANNRTNCFSSECERRRWWTGPTWPAGDQVALAAGSTREEWRDGEEWREHGSERRSETGIKYMGLHRVEL